MVPKRSSVLTSHGYADPNALRERERGTALGLGERHSKERERGTIVQFMALYKPNIPGGKSLLLQVGHVAVSRRRNLVVLMCAVGNDVTVNVCFLPVF